MERDIAYHCHLYAENIEKWPDFKLFGLIFEVAVSIKATTKYTKAILCLCVEESRKKTIYKRKVEFDSWFMFLCSRKNPKNRKKEGEIPLPGECHTTGFSSCRLHKPDHMVHENTLLHYANSLFFFLTRKYHYLVKFSSLYNYISHQNPVFLNTLKQNSPEKELQCSQDYLLHCILDLWNPLSQVESPPQSSKKKAKKENRN